MKCLKSISDTQQQQPEDNAADRLVDRLATMLTPEAADGAAAARGAETGLFDLGWSPPHGASPPDGAIDGLDALADVVGALSAEERLVCWGSPAVRGDAWGHESAAGASVSVRTGGGPSSQAHPVLVVIGGRTTASVVSASGNVSSDPAGSRGGTLVQVFDPSQRMWLRVAQSGVPPCRLRAHTVCPIASKLLITGGGDGKRLSSEIFALEISMASAGGASAAAAAAAAGGSGLVAAVAAAAGAAVSAAAEAGGIGVGLGTSVHAMWSHPQVRGAAPPARVGHCAARLGAASMLIFGGFAASGDGGGGASSGRSSGHDRHGSRKRSGGGKSGEYSNAIYALDAERGTWTMPTVHIASGSAPPLARLGASATALHENEMVIFGGSHRGVPCASLDWLTATTDIGRADAVLHVGQPAVSGAPPDARFNHVACRVGVADVAIFGGGGGADGRLMLGDAALLHAGEMRWAVLEFRGVPPAPRVGATGAVVGTQRRLWVFGGCASLDGLPLNDVHSLEVSRHTDEEANQAHQPAGRGGGGAESGGEGVGAGGVASAGGVGAISLGAQHPAPRLRPPPRARLAPAHHQLVPGLRSRPLAPLRKPSPRPPPPAGDPQPTGGAGGDTSVVLTAQNVTNAHMTATGPARVPAEEEPDWLREAAVEVAKPPAPLPPAPPPTPPPEPSSTVRYDGLPGGGCTTVLVRRDGGYVLKPIVDETCRGCAICHPEHSS